MVADKTFPPSGTRRSRSLVPCSSDRRCSAPGAVGNAQLQELHGSAHASSISCVRSGMRDQATAIPERVGELTAVAGTTDLSAVVATRAARGIPAATAARAATGTEPEAAASTTLASSTPAPNTYFARDFRIASKVNPPSTAGVTQRNAALAANGTRRTTAGPEHKHNSQKGDTVRPCTLGRRTEATHSHRGLKKLHVLPTGQRAENRQVFKVLKMFMKEKTVVQPCMSFRVPLETSLPTVSLSSRQKPVSEAEEAAGGAASGSDISQGCTVVPAAPPRPTSPQLSSCSSSAAASSARPTVPPSLSRHCESTSTFCAPPSPVTSDSYGAFVQHSPRLVSASSCSSSVASAASVSRRSSPSGFTPSSSSSFPSRSLCSCTSYSLSPSFPSSALDERSSCSSSHSRSTTYVVVDCSPASGLLTADTVVYLSGAPLQRLRRVQLMALVHPNSAYGRRAGICSYQQVFERRPDFPCLEQEDQLLLREAPVHVRDFERAERTPGEPATETAGLLDTDATAAGSVILECHRTEDEGELAAARVGDTAPAVRIPPRDHIAAEDPPSTGTAAGITKAKDTAEELRTTCRADGGKSGRAVGVSVLKDVVDAADAATGDSEGHEEGRRGRGREFFHDQLSPRVTARAGRHPLHSCSVCGSEDAEVDAFAADFEQALNAQHIFVASADDHSLVSAVSGVTTPAAASSAAKGFGGGGSSGFSASSDAARCAADFSGKSNSHLEEGRTRDGATEHHNCRLHCCAAEDNTDQHECSCISATTTSSGSSEESSVFRIEKVSLLGNDSPSSSVQRRGAGRIVKDRTHDSSCSRSETSNMCSCPGSNSNNKESRRKNHTAESEVRILPRRVSRSSSILNRFSVASASEGGPVLCSSSADGVSFLRTARGVSREAFHAADSKGVKEGCVDVTERAAACKSPSPTFPRSASGVLRSYKNGEGNTPQKIAHTCSSVCAQPRTMRRVSRLQKHQQETSDTRQRRATLHNDRQSDAQEEAASPHCRKAARHPQATFKDEFSSRNAGEGTAATEDAGLKRTAAPRTGADEEAECLRYTAGAPRTPEEDAGVLWCKAEVTQRPIEEQAGFGGHAERRGSTTDETVSSAGCAAGTAKRQLTTGDVAAATAAVEKDPVETGGTVVAAKSVADEKSVPVGRTITTGQGTAAGAMTGEGATGGRTGGLAERESRVRPTHEHRKVRLQRLDAETLFRFFVGPYLQRKLGKRSTTGKKEGRTEEREEEEERESSGERRVQGSVHCRGTEIEEGSGKAEAEGSHQDDLRTTGVKAKETEDEDSNQPKGTLVLYPGKELVIRDVTFVVWAADPAGVPGLLDEDTVIYICLDPYGEYRRVHFVPFSDTLPTTYTFDFYEDYLKPFLLENKWRNFRRGDVFSYRGVEFKLIATEPSSSVGARVGPATVVYHEGSMQPTVMDVLPADVLYHIRRLPARMQPAAIIFAAQRLDPEVLMRVVPAASAVRSRRGLNEQATEALREKLVHPFSFAAYLRKYRDLCCRVLPSTVERSSEEPKASGVSASMACSGTRCSVEWTRDSASSSGAAGTVGSPGADRKSSTGDRSNTTPRDFAAEKKEDNVAGLVAHATGAGGESSANSRQPEEQATESEMKVVPGYLAYRETRGFSSEATCGEDPYIHTQSALDLEGDSCSRSEQYFKEDVSNFERPSCTVCTLPMEERDASIILFCGHVFHWQCIHLWLRYNSTCPNCRAEINELLQRREDSMWRRRTDSSVERQEDGGSRTGENAPEEEGTSWLINTVRSCTAEFRRV